MSRRVCSVGWGEECSTARRRVGERVEQEQQCGDREVRHCRTVQLLYQQFPRSPLSPHSLDYLPTHPCVYSLGIEGGPGKAYEECEMVTKNICESVPVTKDITAEVETCIQTPKEVGCMSIFV